MPVFEYKAIEDTGKAVAGVLNADTPRDARDRLRAMRLHPTDVRESDVAQEATDLRNAVPQFVRGRRVEELALITRQISTMLRAGIPLSEALRAIIDQMEDARLERVLRDVRERILSGTSFADATKSWYDRSINEAPGCTLPGFRAVASSRQAV